MDRAHERCRQRDAPRDRGQKTVRGQAVLRVMEVVIQLSARQEVGQLVGALADQRGGADRGGRRRHQAERGPQRAKEAASVLVERVQRDVASGVVQRIGQRGGVNDAAARHRRVGEDPHRRARA